MMEPKEAKFKKITSFFSATTTWVNFTRIFWFTALQDPELPHVFLNGQQGNHKFDFHVILHCYDYKFC
jgi:hypothetical protein